MKLHSALDPTLRSTLRRRLSNRGISSRVNSLIELDMAERIDWSTKMDAYLDEPATTPAHTMLLFELPELRDLCVNHGERQFRIVRTQPITVRDVLVELDEFLHRRVPTLVGFPKSFGIGAQKLASEGLENQQQPTVVGFANSTPVSSEDSLSSGDSIPSNDTVMTRWLGEKSAFAGAKCAENHDFKLIVKMTKPNTKPPQGK